MSQSHNADTTASREDYPETAADSIERRARERFAEQIEKYGDGKNWRADAPEDMADKAISKLHEGLEHLSAGRREEAETAFGDVENYMAFALDSEKANRND